MIWSHCMSHKHADFSGVSVPVQDPGCSHSQVYAGSKYLFVFLWKLRPNSGRPNWPLNPRDIMGQAVSEDEDFFFFLYYLPHWSSNTVVWLSGNSSESLFPKTFINLTHLENFKWKSQFLTCFVGAFVMANFWKSVEPLEQLPVELLSTGHMERQQLANYQPFTLISLSNVRNHHPLLLPDVT